MRGADTSGLPLDDPLTIERQYRDPSRLLTRRAVWGPGPSGQDAVSVTVQEVLRAVGGASPPRGELPFVVEIGCGTGALAEQVCRAAAVRYLATDSSAAMVALTRAREVDSPGLTTMQCAAPQLPLTDASVDVLVAAWMLYHVPEVPAALVECARVLRPGGVLIATTNSRRHLATLFRAAGIVPPELSFDAENGAELLSADFPAVTAHPVETLATFADHASATAYLDSVKPGWGARLPYVEGGQQHAGHATVFTATKGPAPRLGG